MELNDKQKRFCREYVKDLNATQAAIRAGYSKNSAAQIGEQNLRKLDIQEYIGTLKEKRAEKVEMDAEWVLRKLKTILETDYSQIVTMTPEEVKELPLEVRQLITAVTVQRNKGEWGESVTMRIKFMDKDRALDSVCKHIGFFEIDNKQKGMSDIKSIIIENASQNTGK